MTRDGFLIGGAVLGLTSCARAPTDARAGTTVGGLGGLVGHSVPSFTVPLLAGGSGSLYGYRDHAVLANLWATWCPPCRHEMPALERLYRTYRAQGFLVVGIDQGENDARVAAFVKKVGVTYPILMDHDQQYGQAFQALGLPTSVFIGRDGTVATTFDGELPFEVMEKNTKLVLRTNAQSPAVGPSAPRSSP